MKNNTEREIKINVFAFRILTVIVAKSKLSNILCTFTEQKRENLQN